MNAVNDKMKLFSDSSFRLVMKGIAMNDVLEQRPDREPEHEAFRHRQDRQSRAGHGEVNTGGD